jgi:hypothetical protein
MEAKKERDSSSQPIRIRTANQVVPGKAAHPTIPDAWEITATLKIEKGWYSSAVELFSRQGGGPLVPLGPMYFESANTNNEETWAGVAFESSGGSPTVYVVEAEFTTHQSERIAGQI